MTKKRSDKRKADPLQEMFDKFIKEHPEALERFNKIIEGEVKMPDEDKVSQKDWSLTHPMQFATGGDKFYADLANSLQKEFHKLRFSETVPEGFVRVAAMSLAAYLEDLVCEIGVWKALRGLYKERYGKWLPFYDCEHGDYLEDDINMEDVKFLIWQAFARCGEPEGRTFSPVSEGIVSMGEIAYDILVESFDKAPASRRVADLLHKVFKKGDYYAFRTLGLWLSAENLLTAPPFVRDKMIEDAQHILDNDKGGELDPSRAFYYVEASAGWSEYICMLGCGSNVILSAIAKDYGYPEVAEILMTVKPLKQVPYDIVSYDKNVVVCRDIRGTEYKMDRDSIGENFDISKIRSGFLQLVKFGDLYEQNGLAIFSPVPLDIEEEKRRREVLIPEFPADMLEMERGVVRRNRGRRVYYFKDFEEIGKLIDFMKYQPDPDSEGDYPENIVVMLSDGTSPVIMPDICGIFSDRTNPFYDPKDDKDWMEEESLRLIMRGMVPDDVAAYIEDKHILPHAAINAMQGVRVGKAIVQDNLRFLMGFYRTKTPVPHSRYSFYDEEE